jgi:hypothetical protein
MATKPEPSKHHIIRMRRDPTYYPFALECLRCGMCCPHQKYDEKPVEPMKNPKKCEHLQLIDVDGEKLHNCSAWERDDAHTKCRGQPVTHTSIHFFVDRYLHCEGAKRLARNIQRVGRMSSKKRASMRGLLRPPKGFLWTMSLFLRAFLGFF